MTALTLRVLVVDDFQPFRRFVCSALRQKPEFEFIHEASDGLEAIHKAKELQPDLILLDIGLPALNGIAAARQIRELAARSKILFVSQESSAEVVEEALNLGAHGYVAKTDAGRELLAAVEAVCQGNRFVSSGLSSDGAAEVLSTGRRPDHNKITRRHEVQFYPDDASFLVGFTRFIESALRRRNPVIVIAAGSRRDRLLAGLQARGWDVASALQQGSYISLDPSDTLASLMINDWPDSARVLKVAGDLITQAARAAETDHPRVAACGECAPTLWMQGKVDAAIQLERLWDDIAGRFDVDILCGYLWSDFQRKENSHIYQRICREHSTVGPP